MNYRDYVLPKNASLRLVMSMFSKKEFGFALFLEDNEKLEGIVTDGDIRRGLLEGRSLDDPIDLIINRNPITGKLNESAASLQSFMKKKMIHFLPVVDNDDRICDVYALDELDFKKNRNNAVLIMAGGYGERLRPLTNECPKPMLRLGDKPLIEHIIAGLSRHGFKKFYVSVYYKQEIIIDYLGDGSRFGVNISYIKEKNKLGTAGALAELGEREQENIIVINGDILLDLNVYGMLDYHERTGAYVTIGVVDYKIQIPYGVIELGDTCEVVAIYEKPTLKKLINAGIYIISPSAIKYIKKNEKTDMNELIMFLRESNLAVSAFRLDSYWIDIGTAQDYARANEFFSNLGELC